MLPVEQEYWTQFRLPGEEAMKAHFLSGCHAVRCAWSPESANPLSGAWSLA